MHTVIVMGPHLNGGWSYHRAYKPLVLTDSQCEYIKAMGGSFEDDGMTTWIRANDPRKIEEYIERLTKEDGNHES